jgi:hypothetical protein
VSWSDYPTDVRQFSGLVQAAAQQRFGSAATIELIAKAVSAAGLRLSFQSYSALASMYGRYVGVREAGASLAQTQALIERTGLDQGITPQMISQPPWSPAAGDFSQNPYVLVRGRYSQDTPAGPVTGYFTHRYNLAEIHTLGQVMTDLQAQIDLGAGGTNLEGAQLQGIAGIEWSTA